MRVFKKALTIVPVIALCFAVFVAADCIRLNNSETGTKPFVTLEEREENDRLIYDGIGYSVEYYLSPKADDAAQSFYGAEFRLFDKIIVWAWVV